MIELRRSGLTFEYLKKLPVDYEGHLPGHQDARLILVEGRVLLATFALREGDHVLAAKLRGHLRHLDLGLGFFSNFHGPSLAITSVRIR